jgi:hypothetical protein
MEGYKMWELTHHNGDTCIENHKLGKKIQVSTSMLDMNRDGLLEVIELLNSQ